MLILLASRPTCSAMIYFPLEYLSIPGYILGAKFGKISIFWDPPGPRGYFLYVLYFPQNQYIRPKYHCFGKNMKFLEKLKNSAKFWKFYTIGWDIFANASKFPKCGQLLKKYLGEFPCLIFQQWVYILIHGLLPLFRGFYMHCFSMSFPLTTINQK